MEKPTYYLDFVIDVKNGRYFGLCLLSVCHICGRRKERDFQRPDKKPWVLTNIHVLFYLSPTPLYLDLPFGLLWQTNKGSIRGGSLLTKPIIPFHSHGLSPLFKVGMWSCLECWVEGPSLFRMINYEPMSPEIAATILSPWRKPNLEWSATVGDSKRRNEIGLASLSHWMRQTLTTVLPLFLKIHKPIQHFYCLSQLSGISFCLQLNK